jgi:anti-sigma B factor antagonist
VDDPVTLRQPDFATLRWKGLQSSYLLAAMQSTKRRRGDSPMHEIRLPPGKENELVVLGEIDAHTAPRIRAVLQTKLREQYPRLRLDCSELDFIDSRGMAALVEYARDAREFGGILELYRLKPEVRTLFAMMRLEQQFVFLD